MNWKLAGMATTALVTVALTGVSAVAGANRFTGNVSLAVSQSFEDDNFALGPIALFDDSFTSITGEGNLNIAFSNNINLQLNFIGVGSFVDNPFFSFDREAGFQAAAHLYWRGERFAGGIFGGAGISSGPDLLIFGSPSAEYYFAGAEGQYYWNNFTFGLAGGYLDSSSDTLAFVGPPFNGDDLFLTDAWFGNAEVRWYAPNNKVAVTANVGYISGDAVFGFVEVDTWNWGAKVEYWPEEKEPLSLWVAYEGRSTEYDFAPAFITDRDKDVHTVKLGITLHFGVDEGGSKAQHQNGPAWNQMDYGAIVVGG